MPQTVHLRHRYVTCALGLTMFRPLDVCYKPSSCSSVRTFSKKQFLFLATVRTDNTITHVCTKLIFIRAVCLPKRKPIYIL
jgi:hypothetical protein